MDSFKTMFACQIKYKWAFRWAWDGPVGSEMYLDLDEAKFLDSKY